MFSIRSLTVSAIGLIAAFGSGVMPATAQQTGADLQIIKSAPDLDYGPGEFIEYTLSISNEGPASATIVQVTDVIPAGTSFVSVQLPAGWTATTPLPGGMGTVSASTSSLAPEATATIILTVRINNNVLPGAQITNTATIDGQQPDPFPASNTSTWVIEIAGQDIDTPGVFNSPSAAWFLRNTNSSGPGDLVFTYGAGGPTQIPLRGDYNIDGTDTPGIYDQSSGAFFLRNSNSSGAANIVFTFGPAATNWIPLAGDWDGDGDDTIGLYDPATGTFFLKNANSAGNADITFTFGAGGTAIPIAGDWNGDGVDTIGIYIPLSSTFFLRNSNSSGDADLAFNYGAAFSTPLAGDWDGDAIDTIGTYVPANGTWFLRNLNSSGNANLTFVYGAPNQTPIVGDWNGF